MTSLNHGTDTSAYNRKTTSSVIIPAIIICDLIIITLLSVGFSERINCQLSLSFEVEIDAI
jgi:hypothetical protein